MTDVDVPYIKVGEVRPSQMAHTYGVGSLVELPYLSIIVTGTDLWKHVDGDGNPVRREIVEPRLLDAVRNDLGKQVQTLESAPWKPDSGKRRDPADWVGAWAWPFPRWLRCSKCSWLTSIDQGIFKLPDINPSSPHEARYVHEGCGKGGREIPATPVRVVMACVAGHLDDFPWDEFAHRKTGFHCQHPDGSHLVLHDAGFASRATDLTVKCQSCKQQSGLQVAFGDNADKVLPSCRGRHPHLRQYQTSGCAHPARAMLVGASNMWFAQKRSVLSIPEPRNLPAEFVAEHWSRFEKMPNRDALDTKADPDGPDAWDWEFLVNTELPLDDIWSEIVVRKGEDPTTDGVDIDLLAPEWAVFTGSATAEDRNFRMSDGGTPHTTHQHAFRNTHLLERLREVVSLTGFTRIDAIDPDDDLGGQIERAPLSTIDHNGRDRPRWALTTESRGEGFLIVLNEDVVDAWEQQHHDDPRITAISDAHRTWRKQRNLEPERGVPDARTILLHTLSHLLINEVALEAGYSTASIRERLYARPADHPAGPMAGILLFTAEPDSEGTLGGLVSLGHDHRLGPIIDNALRRGQLCSTDPFCADHSPGTHDNALHGAACHSCLFLPETSCELANRYLDRSTVVPTFAHKDLALLPWTH